MPKTQELFTPVFYRRLQQLKIRTRRAFLGSRQGVHTSLRRGHGLEFADFRLYTPGDDFRQIDWGVYGRTDRLYIRQFREETELNVVFLIDASASMGLPLGEEKFNMVCKLALALGFVALADGDCVTFSILGRGNIGRFNGARSIRRAESEFERITPGGAFNMGDEVRAAISRQRIPGRCFLISDFLIEEREQFETIDLLRARNFEISVLQVLAPSELSFNAQGEEALIVDSETGEELPFRFSKDIAVSYSAKLADHVGKLEGYCHRSGVDHVLISSAEDAAGVILTRLPEIGILK